MLPSIFGEDESFTTASGDITGSLARAVTAQLSVAMMCMFDTQLVPFNNIYKRLFNNIFIYCLCTSMQYIILCCS